MPAPMPTETELKEELTTESFSPEMQKHRAEGRFLGKIIHDCHLVDPAVRVDRRMNHAHKLRQSCQPEEGSTEATVKEKLEKLKDLAVERQGQDKHQEKPKAPSWTSCTQQCQKLRDSPLAVICQGRKKKGECDPGSDAIDAIDIDCKKQGKKKEFRHEPEFFILEWIFLPTSPPISLLTRTEAIGAVIQKGQNRIAEISGTEPADIIIPVRAEDLTWHLRHACPLQEALLEYSGVVHSEQLKGSLWQIIKRNQWIEQLKSVQQPVKGRTVCTDAGKTSDKTNARALQRQFGLSHAEAQGIVRACPQCSHHGPELGLGINPKGLRALEIWQMDVTHVAEFGRLKYVHVSVDTYSKMVWATAQPGEKGKHVCKHLTACFAVMGAPETVKTDNGPAYISETVEVFMRRWGVKHFTRTPHSPSGQAVIERTHQILKSYLQNKEKKKILTRD
ncbi:hypothetical protein DUI87_29441 [Hirundo rustica rustica]|uniref:RNA-directed DNA polymerase n=1 Tax=Hirundo rustica rustica TaxID=333673 RepID=A0A3M0J060_HIRRU|nr:hypothetical protein DUI87_29441 [Hirundo rustica rustica]